MKAEEGVMRKIPSYLEKKPESPEPRIPYQYPENPIHVRGIILLRKTLSHEIHAHRTEPKPKPKNKDKQNSCPSQATPPSSDREGKRNLQKPG